MRIMPDCRAGFFELSATRCFQYTLLGVKWQLGLRATGGSQPAASRTKIGVAVDPSAQNDRQRLWCSRGMIVTVRGPGDAQISVHVPRPFARIGSDRFAEVCLPQGDLLPCNLYLHATAQGIYCLGLSESAPHGWLTPHTRAEIGPYRIKAVFDDDGPPPEAGETDPRKKSVFSAPTPLLRIQERNGARKPVELAVDRPLTVVGRRSPSVFRMAHRTVSRVHCVLYWTGEALWAINLLSANRTLLDSEPIEAALWNAGQLLSLGDYRIRYLDSTTAAPRPRLSNLAAPNTDAPALQPPGARSRRRSSKRRPASSGSSKNRAAIPQTFAEPRKSAPLLTAPEGRGKDDASESEDRNCFPLSIASPPRSASDSGSQANLPAIVAREQGAVAGREPASTAARWSTLPSNIDSNHEMTQSERQLLQALRKLAASAAPSEGGELPPEPVQALLAMVEQALSQATKTDEPPGELAGLPPAAPRLAIAGEGSAAPVMRLEQELSLVSLTLVKARQVAETNLAPAKADVDRLIEAMRGLEGRLAELAGASRIECFPARESREVLAADRAAALVERQASEPRDGELPAPVGDPAGSLAPLALAPLALANLPPSEAEPAASRPSATDGGKASGASQASVSSDVNAPAEIAPAAGQVEDLEQAQRESGPALAAKEASASARQASRTAAPQLASPPESLIDDQMLSRLVNFKAKQDDVIRRRNVVWAATAAVAIILVVVVTGAATFYWTNPETDGRVGEYTWQDHAKFAE